MYRAYDCEKNGATLRVGEWTGSHPTAIIGIHGLAGNHTHFTALADELSPEYRLIAYDVRGRGHSSHADVDSSINKHADDTIALIESLRIERPVLIGHSMGAYIAAIVASRYKNLAGIILVDGTGEITAKEIEMVRPSLNRLNKAFLTEAAAIEHSKTLYDAMGLEWNEYIEQGLRYGLEEGNGHVRFKGEPEVIFQDLESILHQFDHQTICSRISCPAMLVIATGKMGKRSLYSEESFQKTRAYTPNLQYYRSSGNHYSILLERQPELAKRIRQFINEL